MLYSSGTEVKHGNYGSDSVDSFKTDPDEYIIDSSVHGSKKVQFTAPAVIDGLRFVSNNAWAFNVKATEEYDGSSSGMTGIAPPGYVLKASWSQHGEALERLGAILGKLPGGLTKILSRTNTYSPEYIESLGCQRYV